MPDANHLPFTEEELRFFQALDGAGVRYLLVGLSAAALQGAVTVTQVLDLWFEAPSDERIGEAARAAGGFYASRMEPPMIGGGGLDRLDLVTHCHGLQSFDEEYRKTLSLPTSGAELKVLPLARIIVSKEATNRIKDRAVLPELRATLAAVKIRYK